MFKSIEYKLITFLTLLIVSVAGAAVCFAAGLIYYGLVFVLIIIGSISRLRRHYMKFNRNILFLLNALDNGDYSFNFSETKISRREQELNAMLNRIKEILANARQEVIQDEKFLSLIVDSISMGIIITDSRNGVVVANNAATYMLGMSVFTHIKQLDTVDRALPGKFMSLTPKDKFQFRTENEREELNLSVSMSRIKIGREEFKVYILTNIGNELDEQEMDSWVKLIRVMTHEIMNSIAPITSLSDTLLSAYRQNTDDVPSGELVDDTIEAFETINSTASGLLSFVESYRRFTGVPRPELKEIDPAALVAKIISLGSGTFLRSGIAMEFIRPENKLSIAADENQISQVLLNLLKNATEAVEEAGPDTEKRIIVEIKEKGGQVQINVKNNGNPIPEDVAANIFIPFFTTKESGSGVGLSVSRYIVRLHGGNLKYHREGEWTVFGMVFQTGNQS